MIQSAAPAMTLRTRGPEGRYQSAHAGDPGGHPDPAASDPEPDRQSHAGHHADDRHAETVEETVEVDLRLWHFHPDRLRRHRDVFLWFRHCGRSYAPK
jgi:hypothetical protein